MTESGPAGNIAVVGSVNMDLVVRVARHPRPGETLLGSDYVTHPGGKGANQAVAAARLGGAVRFVGRVGADAFGERLAAALAHDGVDIAALGRSARPSGVAFIQVDERGQNSIVVSPGANHDLSVADLSAEEADAALATASVLMLQLEVPLDVVLAAAAVARRAGALVMLNLAPARRLEPDQLADVGLLLVNEHEAAIQLGTEAEGKTPEEWAVALCRLVPNVVITLGAEGAVWASGAKSGKVQAAAAGDVFAGALAYYLARAGSWAEDAAVRFASAAGALATTRPGAQPSLPALADVTAMLREAP